MSENATIENETQAAAPAAVEKAAVRKTRVGSVVSDKMTKTIVVEVERRVPHPQFKKIVRRTSKFYAHDEEGKAKLGDKVRIEEIRPMSKLKRWKLVEVLAH
ncbi:30S ribosomal protein S17 [Phragmitibacter flavus]|uniref:Small ribosomal subunit protein uS17 n=1 Tax=Phragmitibacter flavus TaxID=2576071 RepID=A0A5R8K9Y7_9BACT|nr:30S ribosomal protein S17 [Phragmitibacter flavus]